MTCIPCKHGETAPGVVTKTFDRGTTLVVIRHVPAEVCQTCGAAYFDGDTAEWLLALAREASGAGVALQVREYAVAA